MAESRGSYPRGIPRFSLEQLESIEALSTLKMELAQAREEIAVLRSALRELDADPDLIKRRAIVRQNPMLRASGLCEMFDHGKIPLPKNMQEQKTWSKAYKSLIYRHRIDSLISKDRGKA